VKYKYRHTAELALCDCIVVVSCQEFTNSSTVCVIFWRVTWRFCRCHCSHSADRHWVWHVSLCHRHKLLVLRHV